MSVEGRPTRALTRSVLLSSTPSPERSVHSLVDSTIGLVCDSVAYFPTIQPDHDIIPFMPIAHAVRHWTQLRSFLCSWFELPARSCFSLPYRLLRLFMLPLSSARSPIRCQRHHRRRPRRNPTLSCVRRSILRMLCHRSHSPSSLIDFVVSSMGMQTVMQTVCCPFGQLSVLVTPFCTSLSTSTHAQSSRWQPY